MYSSLSPKWRVYQDQVFEVVSIQFGEPKPDLILIPSTKFLGKFGEIWDLLGASDLFQSPCNFFFYPQSPPLYLIEAVLAFNKWNNIQALLLYVFHMCSTG